MSRHRTDLSEQGGHLHLASEPLRLTLSRANGALVRIDGPGGSGAAFAAEAPQLRWAVGGHEVVRPPNRAPTYEGTTEQGESARVASHDLVRGSWADEARVITDCADWRATHRYALGRDRRVRVGFEFRYGGGDAEARIRYATWTLELPDVGEGWRVETPMASVEVGSVDPVAGDGRIVSSRPGTGDPGFLVIHHPATGKSLAMWAFSWTFPATIVASRGPRGLRLECTVGVAARLAPGDAVAFDGIWLEPFVGAWEDRVAEIHAWWPTVGLETPTDRPDWTRAPAIYEVHVGETLFREGFVYAPYPRTTDLINDLGRIKELGFDVLQVMPRHPFPSYTVPDFADPDAAWAEGFDDLVAAAHSLDMRIVLDLLLHGVLDREAIDRAVASVREFALTGGTDPIPEYVLNYEQAWRAGVPDRHPLLVEHPDWFARSDDGSVAQAYTHVLDLANPAVQHHFANALADLLTRHCVDGFRFDTPGWHAFPNWDDGLPYPAGHTALGSVELLRRVRQRLRQVRDDVMLYVEATGPLFRLAADANYNYDEQWLVGALLGGAARGDRWASSGPAAAPITARGMAAWFARRRALMPAGSITVHHVDSHDTFWWPPPGNKWRREQYGLAPASALTAAFALIDGGFMLYVGGEEGQEEQLQTILRLRKELPELARGACDYLAVTAADEMVFTALRSGGGRHSVVAVNLSARETVTELRLPANLTGSPCAVYDAVAGEFIRAPGGELVHQRQDPPELRVGFAPHQARLLVLRQAERCA